MLDKIQNEVVEEIKKLYLQPGEDESENLIIQIAIISAETTKLFLEKYEQEKSSI